MTLYDYSRENDKKEVLGRDFNSLSPFGYIIDFTENVIVSPFLLQLHATLNQPRYETRVQYFKILVTR